VNAWWRRQAIVLPIAAVVAVAGGVVWSRVVADDADDVVLTEPGEYVDPASTNPANDGDELPAVELVAVGGSATRLEPDGRPMVVNLWYSTCPPCSRELAAFGAVADDVGDAVRFVGVNPVDDAETAAEYAGDRGADYEQLLDRDASLVDALSVVQFPVTLFVSADGRIVAQTGVLSEDELRRHVAELLE
jgi:thiol-disulfide isomerase/thioredoxin